MADKVYSKINDIPKGSASERLTNACLVLEGGAFRGLYTQGMLDEMMLNDINISCVIGVSAGALGGMNYVSGQIGRSARVNLGFRHDSRYVGAKALYNSHSILDVSFLTEDRGIIEPLDIKRFMDDNRRFVAVTTNCLTGHPVYHEKGKCNDIMQAIRASATMPYISPVVMIDNVPHLDGGCSCKIPYQWAIDEGYDKIIVIKTREVSYRKKPRLLTLPLKVYENYPDFALKLAASAIDYNKQCDEVERLHNEGRILRLAPSSKVRVRRIESDLEKLGDLYELGRSDLRKNLDKVNGYLGV